MGLNFEVGGGFTLTQGIGTTGSWTNETEEFGVEQTNKIALGTSIGRAFGPATINVGVAQEGNIMSDAGAERWSFDDLYDDASTSYYLEFAMSI